ncbi:MAG TPA: hypothetical protein VMV71_01270, partial [Candidatus Paceibacterota bacterium]|nr:hypothetical protein [Candidatus Paceibacterota bacterium]
DLTNITQTQVTGDAGQNLANWIQSFYTFSLVGGVFLAVGVIVWAGLKYTLAAGNPSTQSDARDQILQALLGIVLLLGAFLILYTINPNLTNLAPVTLNSASEGQAAAPSQSQCTDMFCTNQSTIGNTSASGTANAYYPL